MSISLLLEKFPRFILYALILLLPIFFLPESSPLLAIHKQLLLAGAVFVAGALWIIDIMRKGGVSFRWHILFVPLGLFALFSFISALGSGAFTHSFWGANGESDSFLNILLFALLFVLIVNKLAKREYVLRAIGFFVAGAVLGAIALFASSLFSLTFPFGSPYAFSIYAGGAFVLALFSIVNRTNGTNRTYGTYITYFAAAVLFLAVLFTSQWVAWLGIAVGSLLLIYFFVRYQRESANNQRESVAQQRKSVAIPLIILGLSLTFWIIGNPMSNVLKTAPEVLLGSQSTINIAKDTVFSSAKNALFGSGPATFANQYKLHRGPEINSTPFWNLRFENGTGAITSFFATTGILGGGAILVFWLWFLWFIVRFLWKRTMNLQISADSKLITSDTESAKISNKSAGISSAASAVLIGGVYFLLAWFLYATNFMLLFAGFFFVALWAGLRGRQKKIVFSQSSANMFWGMVGSVALLVVFVFGAYNIYKNYLAEAYYLRGVDYINVKDYSSAVSTFQEAVKIRKFDKYLRGLSRALFLRTDEIFHGEELTSEEKNSKAQEGLIVAETSAALAISVNPNNSENFEGMGDFYTAAIPLSGGAATMPFAYYNESSKLNPKNPRIPLKKARAHLVSASRLATEDKDTDSAREAYARAIEEARKEAENALMLKGDFKDAIEFLASLPRL